MKKKLKSFFWILIFLILIIFIFPQNLLASSLHTLSDKMTRHAPLTASDHEIKFTTPSGIGESGQYLRIFFDSGFDLAAIDYTDIDLFHGPLTGLEIQETLSLVPGLTSWGVSVSGSQIDFTHPTNNLNGDISSNDIIVIRIGLNASGGDQQIINPATTGSKVISIIGNFGDNGKLAVPIFQDQIFTGGQAPATPPQPVVLNTPANILLSSMFLSWSQNLDFDFDRYELYYSETPGVTNLNGILATTTTDNTLTNYTLIGLSSNTLYYFVVYVYDTEALEAASNEVFATTQSGGNPIPPRPDDILTVDEIICPFFLSPTTITGTKPNNTIILINGLADNIDYPSLTTWNSLVNLNLGDNLFDIWARDIYSQISDILSVNIERWKIGDTNGDFFVDDFDIAGLAWNWYTDWCFADFNQDGIVDDFDIAGLASNWDGIY